MIAALSSPLWARLAASAADEYTYLQDWRAGIPTYRAPTLDPECSYWEVTYTKKQSPCSITGVPRFFPLGFHGSSDRSISAIHTSLLSAVNMSGIHLNRLHSFMLYRPVKCAIRTFMLQLELRQSTEFSPQTRPDHEWICSELAERLGQRALGEVTADGPRYLDRCLASCLQKLIDLHDDAGFFWDFGTGKTLLNLLGTVIDLFLQAWDAYRPWAASGTTVEDWFFWTNNSDPWIACPNEFTLEARPISEYWPAKPPQVPKRSKTPPPWGVWKPTPAELAALHAEALGSTGKDIFLPPAPTEPLWEFESILDCKWQGKGRKGKVWFLVQWKGFEATWQPEDDFIGCSEDVLMKFYEKPRNAGPPKWLMA
jgi:hypothetical protein